MNLLLHPNPHIGCRGGPSGTSLRCHFQARLLSRHSKACAYRDPSLPPGHFAPESGQLSPHDQKTLPLCRLTCLPDINFQRRPLHGIPARLCAGGPTRHRTKHKNRLKVGPPRNVGGRGIVTSGRLPRRSCCSTAHRTTTSESMRAVDRPPERMRTIADGTTTSRRGQNLGHTRDDQAGRSCGIRPQMLQPCCVSLTMSADPQALEFPAGELLRLGLCE